MPKRQHRRKTCQPLRLQPSGLLFNLFRHSHDLGTGVHKTLTNVPSKGLPILTALSLVTGKCPGVLCKFLLSQCKGNTVSQQKVKKK